MIEKVLKRNDDGTSVVRTMPCISCGQATNMTIDTSRMIVWMRGTNVQYAFPDMSTDDRELLINGTHSECFDKMFREEEE